METEMKKLIVSFALVVLFSTLLMGKSQSRDWKTGLLIDSRSERDSRLVGTMNGSSGVLVQARNDATYYEIDAGDVIYVAKRTLIKRGDKQLKVTVNAPVKFAISGDDFYLLDEDGKEHKLSIEKKTAKPKKD
jgi:hypothetical protein